jgi:hypothetical protein
MTLVLVLVLVLVLRWMASCSTRFRSLKPRERGPTTARCSLLVDTRSELTVSDLRTRSCRTLLACNVCIDSDARMHSVGTVLVMCWVDGVRLMWGFACCWRRSISGAVMQPFLCTHKFMLTMQVFFSLPTIHAAWHPPQGFSTRSTWTTTHLTSFYAGLKQ